MDRIQTMDESIRVHNTSQCVANTEKNLADVKLCLMAQADNCDTNLSSSKQQKYTQDKCMTIIPAFMIVVSAFLSYLLTCGFSFSIGIYYVEFLNEFKKGSALTSVVGSLNFGALCAAGPLASFLIEKFGCHITLMIGGLVSVTGIFSTVFAQSLYMVYATFGIVAGVGFGLVFTTCLSAISYNFDRWRTFCMGFTMSGVGLGTFLHPFLGNFLINYYGWRGALLITSGITMHVCLMSILLRFGEKRMESNHQKTRSQPVSQSTIDLHLKGNTDTIVCNEYDLHKSIWALPKYWVLHINVFLFCFGQSVVITHVASLGATRGLNKNECASFISILGLSNLCGRILLGLVTHHPSINCDVLYNACYLIAGLCTIFFSLWYNYTIMALTIVLLGVGLAAFGPILSEVVLQTVGLTNFPKGYGFLMMSMAVGTLLGAPSAGWLYDATRIYNNSFYLGGASFILSASVMVLEMVIQKTRNHLKLEGLRNEEVFV